MDKNTNQKELTPEEIERLQRMGVVGPDGKWLPVHQWPPRLQRGWYAFREIIAVQIANPGLKNSH